MGTLSKIFGFLIGLSAIVNLIGSLLGMLFNIGELNALGMFIDQLTGGFAYPIMIIISLFWLWVASKLWHWGKPKQ